MDRQAVLDLAVLQGPVDRRDTSVPGQWGVVQVYDSLTLVDEPRLDDLVVKDRDCEIDTPIGSRDFWQVLVMAGSDDLHPVRAGPACQRLRPSGLRHYWNDGD